MAKHSKTYSKKHKEYTDLSAHLKAQSDVGHVYGMCILTLQMLSHETIQYITFLLTAAKCNATHDSITTKHSRKYT